MANPDIGPDADMQAMIHENKRRLSGKKLFKPDSTNKNDVQLKWYRPNPIASATDNENFIHGQLADKMEKDKLGILWERPPDPRGSKRQRGLGGYAGRLSRIWRHKESYVINSLLINR